MDEYEKKSLLEQYLQERLREQIEAGRVVAML